MRIRYVAAVMAIALSGCMTPSQPGVDGRVATTIEVESGHEFEIAVNQEAKLTGTTLSIRFRGVSNDSRCPSDVKCVWAGNAVARLTLAASGHSNLDASLNTTLDPKMVKYAGYTLTLKGLKPIPKSGSSIPSADYVAVLEVAAN